MEMWKLTDATGVYVQPQKHPTRTHFIGNWYGLALFIDLDKSSHHDWPTVQKLIERIGGPLAMQFPQREGK
jgi:hypothetical protein